MAENPLHKFARAGDLYKIRKAVATGADVNAKDEVGATPLDCAIAKKHPDAAELLLELDADVSIQDNDGSTALQWAIEHGLPDVLQALLNKCPEAVSISDKHGNQALWYAAKCARGDYEMVKMLLKCGADTTHRNKVDLSPIDLAKDWNDAELLQLFESARSSKK